MIFEDKLTEVKVVVTAVRVFTIIVYFITLYWVIIWESVKEILSLRQSSSTVVVYVYGTSILL